MGTKSLKTYGVTFSVLKKMSTTLNALGIADEISTKVGTKGVDMLDGFLDAIASIPDAMLAEIPDEVAAFYNALPQELFSDSLEPEDTRPIRRLLPHKLTAANACAEPATAPIPDPKALSDIESDCPAFGEGWDPSEHDCKMCAKEMTEEHDECKRLVLNAQAKEKEKAAKRAKKNGGKPTNGNKIVHKGKRTRYGHMPKTMSGCIDDLVHEGRTIEEITRVLVERFDRDEDKARRKARSHIRHLVNKVGITVTVDDETGVIQAEEEYAEGYSSGNTMPGCPNARS